MPAQKMGRRVRDDLRRKQQRHAAALRATRVEEGWGMWSDADLDNITSVLDILPGADYTRTEINTRLAAHACTGFTSAIRAAETLKTTPEFIAKLQELECTMREIMKAKSNRLDRERKILADRQRKFDAALPPPAA
jgi:hypothetical protein